MKSGFRAAMLVVVLLAGCTSASEWSRMPESAGWRVCGFEFTSWSSLSSAYASADGWRNTLRGLDDTMGCSYTDRVVFGQHDWPVGSPWGVDAMRAEVSRGQLYCSKEVSEVTRYGGRQTCGSPNRNLGFHYTFKFSVATATTVKFRYGGDYGNGGVLSVDNEAVGVILQDHWWAGRTSRSVETTELSLSAGDHVFEAIGFENCCDGAHNAQFQVAGGDWMDLKVSTWLQHVPVWSQSTIQPVATMSVYYSTYVAFPKNFAAHAAGRFATTTDDFHQWKVCGDGGHLLVIDGTVISTKSWAHNNYKCYTHKVYLTAGAHSIEVMHFAKRKINRLIVTGGPGTTTSEAHVITLAPIQGLCYQGQKYFTLAEAHPMATQYQCQAAPKALPASSTVAPNDDTTKALVRGSWFGTECLVLADGSSYRTAGSLASLVSDEDVSIPVSDTDSSSTEVKGKKGTSKFSEVTLAETGWSVGVDRSCSASGTMDVPATYATKLQCCAPASNATQAMLSQCADQGCQYQTADDGLQYCSVSNGYTDCLNAAKLTVSAQECSYQVTIAVDGSSKDLSHTTLALPSDLAACGVELVSLGDLASPALDPTTGVYGLKYDTEVKAGATKVLSLVTREYASSSARAGTYAVKGNTVYALGDIGEWISCAVSTVDVPASVASLDFTADQQECGTGKLTVADGLHSADCSDGVTRRVLGVRSLCDPGDIDIADRTIRNYVVLNGVRYATLDDASPAAESNQGGCGDVVSMLPAGWAFASYDDNAKLLAMFGDGAAKFGVSCLVYSDGRGRSHSSGSFGQVCAENAIESLPVVGGSLVRVFEHWCPARILISRPADDGEADTLSTLPSDTVDKTRAILGFHYAALDNTPPATGTSGCQARPITLPDGWEIAPADTAAVDSVRRFFPFGTQCLVYADGASVGTCGGAQLLTHTFGGKSFHTVTSCDARVLIRHEEIFDRAMLAETCGVCTGWGDPHQVTFDRVRFDSYGGELILKVLVPGPAGNPCTVYGEAESLCDFNIYSWQVPLGRVTTNKAVMVQHSPVDGTYESIVIIVDHTIKQRSNTPHMEIDGTVTELDVGSAALTTARGAIITRVVGFRKAPAWEIKLPNDIKMVVSQGYYRQPLLHYTVTLPKRFRGEQTVYGLCGDCDGNPSNDFFNPDLGAAQTIEATKRGPRNAEIQNKFINSIVVTGPNPFLPTSTLPEPPTATEQPEACVDASQKVLDLADTCCADLTGAELELCQDEVCTTESCESMDVLEDVETAEDEVITGPKEDVTCDYAPMTSIEFAPAIRGGRVYATLDGAANDGSAGGSQTVDYAVPTGWSIAANDEVNIANAGCFSFGTECLILADGSGVRTDGTADSCGTHLLLRSGQNGACIRPTDVNMRVLITKDLDVAIDTMLNSGSGLTTSNQWYPEDATNVIAHPTDVEDPAANAVVRVDGSPGTVAGVFRRWRLADHSSVTMNHYTAPMSGSVWVRVLSGAAHVASTPASEWVYAELDIVMSDGVTITERYYDFSAPTGQDISHGWEELVIDLNLPRLIARQYNGLSAATVSEIVVHLAVHQMTGQAEFGEPVWSISRPSQFNYIKNGAFNTDISPSTGDAFANWITVHGTPTVDTSSSVAGLGRHPEGGSGSLKLAGTGNQQVSYMHKFGSANGYLYDETAPGAILFCTWHKATNIINTQSAGSSLYVDFLCAQDSTVQNCNAYANVLPTEVGTRGWYRTCHSFETRGYLTDRMVTTARLTQGAADSESHFDGVFAMPSCSGPNTKRLVALAYGDPHIITGDNVRYDAQWIGEYTVYDDQVMKVQQRHAPAGTAAVVSAVVMLHYVSGTTVQFDRPGTNGLEPVMRVNGRVVSGNAYVGDNIAVSRRGSLVAPGVKGFGSMVRFVIKVWGEQPDVSQEDTDATVMATSRLQVDVQNTVYGTSFMAISFIDPADVPGNTPRGLLGNFNGDPADDFGMPDGTIMAGAPEDADALKAFVEAWRVKTDRESIFTYTRGENLRSHYDPTFVPGDPSQATEAERQAAVATCTELGIGSVDTLAECVSDVLSGGEGYAVGAASLSAVGYSEGQSAMYDITPPFTDDSNTEEDAVTTGFLAWALIGPMLGTAFFTALFVSVSCICLSICFLRCLRVHGWSLVQRRESLSKSGFTRAPYVERLGTDLDMIEQGMAPPGIQRTVSLLINSAARQLSSYVSESDYGGVKTDSEDSGNERALPGAKSVEQSDEPDIPFDVMEYMGDLPAMSGTPKASQSPTEGLQKPARRSARKVRATSIDVDDAFDNPVDEVVEVSDPGTNSSQYFLRFPATRRTASTTGVTPRQLRRRSTSKDAPDNDRQTTGGSDLAPISRPTLSRSSSIAEANPGSMLRLQDAFFKGSNN